MNKISTLLAVVVIAALGSGWFLKGGAVAAQSSTPETQPSAQVVTTRVQAKQMHASVTAFGDVLPERVQSISSVSTAQIAQLNVTQGQGIHKGQVLAVLDGDPSVKLAYEQARTSLAQANAELERMQSMAKLQLATQAQVDAATKAKADALAGLTAQESLGGGKGGLVIKAPSDGVVVSLTSAQGDRVQAGAPFMQFGLTDKLKIILGIDPADLGKIKKGMPVRLASLTDESQVASSSVLDVQNVVDPKMQLASVLVYVPAASHFVPGSRVRAEIELDPQSAYEVPRQAVLTDANGSYVYQVANKVAHRVAVLQAVDNRQTVGVTGAIDPSLPLVVQGNYELDDGMHVREEKR
jgi:RND family efflux transporter MFP subunit